MSAKVNCLASPGSRGSVSSWHTAAPRVAPFTLPSSLVVAALPVAAAAASASEVPEVHCGCANNDEIGSKTKDKTPLHAPSGNPSFSMNTHSSSK